MDDGARDRRSGAGGRPYAAELRACAAELRRDGVGSRQVAEQLGVSRATVCRWFREDGVLPLDLERHDRAKVWAAEQAARRALDPARSYPGHRRHDPELREVAAEMRRQGLPRAEIARELGVGFSTVSRWFREDGVELGGRGLSGRAAAQAAHRRTIDDHWARQDAEQRGHAQAVGSLTPRELLLVTAALYWAEGAKSKPWRRRHLVQMSNTDPAVILLFLDCLEQLGVARTRIVCSVQIHITADAGAAQSWWREQLGRDLTFHRPSLKRHTPRTNRNNTGEGYHGCLLVTVHQSADLYRLLVGTWEGVAAGASRAPSPVV
ncbi:MAG: helix-turn-helix domain-containing protein [Quadrisphaera sp.]